MTTISHNRRHIWNEGPHPSYGGAKVVTDSIGTHKNLQPRRAITKLEGGRTGKEDGYQQQKSSKLAKLLEWRHLDYVTHTVNTLGIVRISYH